MKLIKEKDNKLINIEWMDKKRVRIINESEYMKLLEYKFRYLELKEMLKGEEKNG